MTLGVASQVEVSRFELDLPPAMLAALERALSDEELMRAARFRDRVIGQHFIAARGALRLVLGERLGCPPSAVPLRRSPCLRCGGPHGKPNIEGVDLAFNLSHSGGVGVVAISSASTVGVDVERVRECAEADAIVDRYFHSEERDVVRAAMSRSGTRAFFAHWTMKEAVVKATGEGLGRGFDTFSVVRRDRIETGGGAAWAVEPIAVGPDYVGAVAGPSGRVIARVVDLDLRRLTAHVADDEHEVYA